MLMQPHPRWGGTAVRPWRPTSAAAASDVLDQAAVRAEAARGRVAAHRDAVVEDVLERHDRNRPVIHVRVELTTRLREGVGGEVRVRARVTGRGRG